MHKNKTENKHSIFILVANKRYLRNVWCIIYGIKTKIKIINKINLIISWNPLQQFLIQNKILDNI